MRYLLTLGSNLGDKLENLEFAIARLPEVLEQSSIFISSPVDMEPIAQDFANMAVCVRYDDLPHKLLRLIHEIEDAAGRLRPYRNAPRTLDIDIIYAQDIVVESLDLKIPHPRASERLFVLAPIAEIDQTIASKLAGFEFSLEDCLAGNYASQFIGQSLRRYIELGPRDDLGRIIASQGVLERIENDSRTHDVSD